MSDTKQSDAAEGGAKDSADGGAKDSVDGGAKDSAKESAKREGGFKKYVPHPEGINLEFHLPAVATGMLHIQRCGACRTWRHPPRWYCPSCHSDQWSFEPVSGRGTIYSMAINHFTVDRAWIEEVPFVTAVVELEEGPRVVGALRGLPHDQAQIGMAVVITPDPRGDDFAFLWVDPVDGTA